jgi:hypothetical protein
MTDLQFAFMLAALLIILTRGVFVNESKGGKEHEVNR